MERWITFDCYGTLADWLGGMRGALRAAVGDDADRLLDAYHRFELEVETERPLRRYRDVLTETLRRAAAAEAIEMTEPAALAQAQVLRRQRRETAHGLFERDQLLLARVAAEQAREAAVRARVRVRLQEHALGSRRAHRDDDADEAALPDVHAHPAAGRDERAEALRQPVVERLRQRQRHRDHGDTRRNQ